MAELGPKAIEQLRQTVHRVLGGTQGDIPFGSLNHPHPANIRMAVTTSAIVSQSTGTAELYKFDPSTTSWTATGTTVNVKDILLNPYTPIGSRVVLGTISSRWCILTFMPFCIGKLDATCTDGGSATVSVWSSTVGGTIADTSENITARDWCLQSGFNCTTGSKVICGRTAPAADWFIVQVDNCPTS